MMPIYQPILLLLTVVATFGKGVNGHTISHDNLRHRPSLLTLTSNVNREPTTTTTRPVNVEDKESYRNKDAPLFDAAASMLDRRALPSCQDDEQLLRIDLTTDNYGFETSWVLEVKQNDGKWDQLKQGPPEGINYGDNTRYLGVYCLPPGDYKFIIADLYNDGFCCNFGNGKYAGYVGGSEVFASPKGDSEWSERIHHFSITVATPIPTSAPTHKLTHLIQQPKIDLGYQDLVLSGRDQQWLESHNIRRKDWHERYNTTYVPLSWSKALKADAHVWAEKLLDSCGEGLYHDPNTSYGENIAGNSGSGGWGALKSTDKILARFVEREEGKRYPNNSHLTQVIWRATKYVGCADAERPKEGGGMCRTQVCRYSRPANCNMNAYKQNSLLEEWWVEPMLEDDSGCAPECPPDGCH